MSDWLEVRIPISPLEHYFNRIQLIACSIRSLGGRYADVRVRVTVGADQEPEDLYARLPWSRAAGVDWVWVDRADFNHWKSTQHEYIATMMERFRPPFSTRQVLMLDADVLVMREFDELSNLLDSQSGIAGVMAHVSPFRAGAENEHLRLWRLLFETIGLDTPPFMHEHSGWGIMEHSPERRFSPPYFNTGVVLASASILESLYAPYMRALNSVRGVMDSYFFEQIALTLALLETGIPAHVLPLRYNYPNQPEFDLMHSGELESVRFLHFLRTQIVQREADFASLETMEQMATRTDLGGSNELLRRRVAELLPLTAAGRACSHEEDVH
jgi:hypothetical protein